MQESDMFADDRPLFTYVDKPQKKRSWNQQQQLFKIIYVCTVSFIYLILFIHRRI